jgi:hypothetical protein
MNYGEGPYCSEGDVRMGQRLFTYGSRELVDEGA